MDWVVLCVVDMDWVVLCVVDMDWVVLCVVDMDWEGWVRWCERCVWAKVSEMWWCEKCCGWARCGGVGSIVCEWIVVVWELLCVSKGEWNVVWEVLWVSKVSKMWWCEKCCGWAKVREMWWCGKCCGWANVSEMCWCEKCCGWAKVSESSVCEQQWASWGASELKKFNELITWQMEKVSKYMPERLWEDLTMVQKERMLQDRDKLRALCDKVEMSVCGEVTK